MRFLKGLCVLVLTIGLTSLVYAETQSVKISGDLAIRSINRNNYDLDHNHQETTQGASVPSGASSVIRTGGQDDWETYFMTTAEVQIDADLTDNVSAVLRLFNQRDWSVQEKAINDGGTSTTARWSSTTFTNLAGFTPDTDEFDVGLDLAYIELKEFLYSPLTLRIGRQDIWFGRGFIVGVQQRDYNANISANEYTTLNSFDAIRATLDYDPWTIDFIASKIWENTIGSKDDVNLFGANVGYVFDVYNAEAEAYWFMKNDESFEPALRKDHNTVNTVGLRGSFDPIENWTVALEGAYQYGHYVGHRLQQEQRKRSAWAIDAYLECRHFQEQYAWKPKLALEYIYYSGDRRVNDLSELRGTTLEAPSTTGAYTAWDMMYRGYFPSAIRDFQGLWYETAQDYNNKRVWSYYQYPDASGQNQHQVMVQGTVQPTDSLTLDVRYFNFWQQYATSYRASDGWSSKKKYLGAEVDVNLTWDYTEDVSFGLLAAWYFPGGHYMSGSDDIATDLVGTVKLSF